MNTIRKNKFILAAIIYVMTLSNILALGFDWNVAWAADDVSRLATKAAKNNIDAFLAGTAVDGSYINIDAYDVYMLSEAGIDVSSYVYEGKSLKENAIDLGDATLSFPNNSKNVAYAYLAMKSIGENAKANDLLDLLTGMQNSNGAFDSNIYTDMSAFDALGRGGIIGELNTQKAVEYIISKQDELTGSWGYWDPDFMTTAQAIRSLIYLKQYISNKDNVQARIEAGIEWIKKHQQEDGSFVYGEWDDPFTDTVEVIHILDLLGENLNSWKKNEKGPKDYLIQNALNEDGSFGVYKGISNNTQALDVFLKLGGIVDFSISEGDYPIDKPIEIPETMTVSIQVSGDNGIIVSRTDIDVDSGDTVMDVLKNILDERGISYYISGGYVKSINGLAEFDKGPKSGWMFNLNGTTINASASDYEVSNGAYIYWFYTSDYTTDDRNTDKEDILLEIADEETINAIIEKAKEILKEKNEGDVLSLLKQVNNYFEKEVQNIAGKDGLEEIYNYFQSIHDVFEDALEIIDSQEGIEEYIEETAVYSNYIILLGDNLKDENKIEKLIDAIMNLTDKIQDKLNTNNNTNKMIKKEIKIKANENQDSVKLHPLLMEKMIENNIDRIVIETNQALLKLSPEAIGEVAKENAVVLKAVEVDPSSLSDKLKAQLPEEILLTDLSIKVGEEDILEFKEPIQVSIPYDGDIIHEDKLTVYCLKEDATTEVIGGIYNSDTKMMHFITNHLSMYFAKEAITSFIDLEESCSLKDKIEAMASKGIIKGRENEHFDPNAQITRAEFAAIITRMLKCTSKDKPMDFEDVKADIWYYESVKLAYENNIINGKANGIFDPKGYITTQEITKIIENTLLKEGYKPVGEKELEDVGFTSNIPDWAKSGIALSLREGILKDEDAKIAHEPSTRVNAVVMLYKLYGLIYD